jgi:hypothetical protein
VAAEERALPLAQNLEPGRFSCLHDELVAGRRRELDALDGLVVRRAAEQGVAVPMSAAISAILEPWAIHTSTPRGEWNLQAEPGAGRDRQGPNQRWLP